MRRCVYKIKPGSQTERRSAAALFPNNHPLPKLLRSGGGHSGRGHETDFLLKYYLIFAQITHTADAVVLDLSATTAAAAPGFPPQRTVNTICPSPIRVLLRTMADLKSLGVSGHQQVAYGAI